MSTVVLQHVLILTRVCSVCEGTTGATATATATLLSPAQPQPELKFDVNSKVVEFNAKKQEHKNLKHTKGRRIVLVFSYYDMDFVGQSNDPRTVELKEKYADLSDYYLQELEVNDGRMVEFARANLFSQFLLARWEEERCASGGNHSKYLAGQTIKKMSLGAKRLLSANKAKLLTRRSSNTSAQQKMLWDAVQSYAKLFCPRLCEYDSCFVAMDAFCDWHCDDNSNIGPSAITAIGDYEGGGELLIKHAPATATAVPLPASAGEQYLCMRCRLSLVCAVRMQVRKWHSW